MPRPMMAASFAPAGGCPVCRAKLAKVAELVGTRGGVVMCAAHEATVMPDAIVARGGLSDVRGVLASR